MGCMLRSRFIFATFFFNFSIGKGKYVTALRSPINVMLSGCDTTLSQDRDCCEKSTGSRT